MLVCLLDHGYMVVIIVAGCVWVLFVAIWLVFCCVSFWLAVVLLVVDLFVWMLSRFAVE